jgi:ABC-2 type transport system permease protein
VSTITSHRRDPSGASVLTGHVLGTLLQSMLALAVVLVVALLVGLRPNANPPEWMAAIAVLLMVWFAEHQPFIPFTETVRGLLLGTEIGSHAFVTAIWCMAITVLGYLASRALYNRDPSR